jgi:hypothetical protein
MWLGIAGDGSVDDGHALRIGQAQGDDLDKKLKFFSFTVVA